ncbi:hypothetical protein ACFY8S_40290 [Streptomyces hygroscopicus]|uniref:hypothetical protein n=1 Tax=Streptomyces hygroscopicus TaxID=1912 RepID=UPI003678665C
MSANQKRVFAYALCFPVAFVVGGCCTGVAALFDASPLGIVSAGIAGFMAVMGTAIKLIGPFDF